MSEGLHGLLLEIVKFHRKESVRSNLPSALHGLDVHGHYADAIELAVSFIDDLANMGDTISRLQSELATLRQQLGERDKEIERLRNRVRFLNLSPSDRAHLRGD